MATRLFFGRDEQGYNAFAPEPSTTIFSATLVNGAAESITLPTNAKKWVLSFSFQPGTNVFVDFSGATAAAPAGSAFASTTSVLNPGSRLLNAKKSDGNPTEISLITNNATAAVTVELYAVRG